MRVNWVVFRGVACVRSGQDTRGGQLLAPAPSQLAFRVEPVLLIAPGLAASRLEPLVRAAGDQLRIKLAA